MIDAFTTILSSIPFAKIIALCMKYIAKKIAERKEFQMDIDCIFKKNK